MIFATININSLVSALLFFDAGDSDITAALPLLLCLAGFIYFGVIYTRYRNSDKRHHHETETVANIQKLQQYDQFRKHRKHLRNSKMSDRNDAQIEGALNQGDKVTERLANAQNLIR